MKDFVLANYKDENGNPIILTDSQAELFSLIFQKRYARNHVMTFTRYGKSFICALAVLARVTTFPEKWCVVAGREKQARIIMGYMIDHIFDNPYMKGKFEIPKDESEERIRRERSRSRLTFRHPDGSIGEVYVLSADSRNRQTAGDAVMGFGAPNLILDEAALIDDEIESKVFRMLGDKMDNFYFKIGNPFRLNHFYKDYQNPKFHHFSVDCVKGIQEKRLTPEFVDEARSKPLFSVLYENKFSPSDMIDDRGYMPLLQETDFRYVDETVLGEKVKLGIDPAGEGADLCTWVIRDAFTAQIVGSEQISTPKSIAYKTWTILKQFNIPNNQVYLDSFGVGASVIRELALSGVVVRDVNVGNKCINEDEAEKFYNERARIFWNLREWLKRGGTLVKNPNWKELLNLKYRAEVNRKIKIMSKDDMRRLGIMSPNFADALALTFYEPDIWGEIKDIYESKSFDRFEL